MGWIRRFRNLTRRRRLDRDLDREIAFHMAEKIDDFIASGMSEREAQLAASRIFGNATVQKERTRDMDIIGWIESVAQDLRYGLRMIRKSPMFALVVVLSLSIGIGANATLFSLIDAMLLRNLPLERPNELVYFEWGAHSNWLALNISGTTNRDLRTGEATSTSFSYETFRQFREQTQTLSGVIAFAPLSDLAVSVDGQSGLVDNGQLTSGNYFSALGAEAVIGRTLTEDDDRQAQPVAVISYRYWERQFDKKPDVLGKPIVVNGVPLTIIGVTRPEFVGTEGFAQPTDIFFPLTLEPQLPVSGQSRTGYPWRWWVRIMGRMKPGVTFAQVHAELEHVFQVSALDAWKAAPQKSRGTSPPKAEIPRLIVLSGSRGLEDNVSAPSLLLIPLVSIAGILLLIVCVNVANLLLARTATRHGELSVRLAVGGSRMRVVRQLLTEIVLMSLLGGGLSIFLAYWARGLIVAALPAVGYDLRFDPAVLVFTAVIAVTVAVFMGLAPALRATGEQINPSLKEGSRTLLGPRTRLSKTLLTAQIALSVVLLVGAGLFLRTVQNLRNVDVGFNTNDMLIFRVNPGAVKYDKTRTAQFYDQVLERISALPGVRAATFSTDTLVTNSGSMSRMYYEGKDLPTHRDSVRILRVRANFFNLLGVPILSGRDLSSGDTLNSPQVAVINETMAHRMFGNSNAVGARVGFEGQEHSGDIEIIGIAKDISLRVARDPIPPAIFLPDLQDTPGFATFAVRAGLNLPALSNSIREAVRQVDSNIPILGLSTQNEQVEKGFIFERVFADSTAFFGVVALFLACIGLFGLMSYSVARRTNEIGVRMALGASQMDVVQLVMRQTFLFVFTGIIVGLALALAAGKVLANLPFLYKVSPNDPITLGIPVATMVAIACIAAYLPARRAARVDPSIALRCE